MSSRLFYYGTDEEMQLGDRILIRRWFRSDVLATVTYIPGISPLDRGLGDDQWAYQTEDGSVYAAGYAPDHPAGQLRKHVRFVCHSGAEAEAAIKSLEMPDGELPPETGRDLLALIGCGVVVLIAACAIVALGKWLFTWVMG